MNLYGLLASRFPAEGEAPCLVLHEGRQVSYAELESQSARYGALLVEAGLKPGDRVAAQVEKSAEALFLYLGCLRAGCVFLPLNPAYTRGEVAYFLGDARPGLFVCAPERQEEAQELAWACRFPLMHDLGARGEGSLAAAAAQMPARFASVERDGDDLAAIVYTSGTTGRSKGAMLSPATWPPTRGCCTNTGASARATCCCTCCRPSMCTACSSPRTARCSTAARCCSSRSSTRRAPCS